MDTRAFQIAPMLRGEDAQDTAWLLEMADEARRYLTSHKWCPGIERIYLAHGAGVVAIFLVEFSQEIDKTDRRLWVVVGDLPSAYLVVKSDDYPANALERYCSLMEDWISAVRDSGDLSSVYPVAAKPTAENADLLERRVAFLLAEIIPLVSPAGK